MLWFYTFAFVSIVVAAWTLVPLWRAQLKGHCIFLLCLAMTIYAFLGGYKPLHEKETLEYQASVLSEQLKTKSGIQVLITRFQKMASENRNDPQAWYWLGRMYMRANQPKNAEEALKKAHELAEELPIIRYHYVLARIAASKGYIDHKSMALLNSLTKYPEFSKAIFPWLQRASQQNDGQEKNSSGDAG